ncbi:hypothetical protein IU449_12040 [Nocardia higoensis]|uniref:Uncharacterized protein n=1 Tax=Nocardia higoensis TaxID=228599 RepID=A0ABS0D9Y8_9NOCA|nr:hypothetical protein [Nocardia higoensis]MBF6355264.1 hypothetical protein [Nocardia higoensis]
MDGYDRDRRSTDNNTRGRVFENGADLFFRDSANGYIKQSGILNTHAGAVRFDKFKKAHGCIRSIEEKSGRLEGKKDEKQLHAVRVLLENNGNHYHVLRSVEGEHVSKEVRELIEGLQRDFPKQFTHRIVSRAEAREIWALGLQLERGQQLELPGVGRQAREQVRERKDPGRQKAFTKALAAGKSLANQREQHREQVQKQLRGIAERAENGKPLDPGTLEKQHERLTRRLENIREAERRNERALLQSLGLQLSDTPMRTLEQLKEEQREQRRQDVVRGLEQIGREVERGHWREIADQHNTRVHRLGVEYVRSMEQRYHGREGAEREIAIDQARRQAERLLITPEKVAGLDLERFRAVRDGHEAGYNSPNKTHTYQRSGMPAVEVEHDAPERRLARMVHDVDRGLAVDQVLMREVLEVSTFEPATEAVRRDVGHRQSLSRGRHRAAERDRERGIDRGPDRGR